MNIPDFLTFKFFNDNYTQILCAENGNLLLFEEKDRGPDPQDPHSCAPDKTPGL